MFKHLLVPLDGSALAEAALPAARYLAEQFNAKLTLFHVVEEDAPQQVHGQQHLTGSAQARAYLEGIRRGPLAGLQQTECHVHETATAQVAESIINHAEELGHDLVVMCSHGRGRSLHLLLGSIAQQVLAGGTVPVVITHPDEAGAPRPFQCARLLVPLDDNLEHQQVLPVAADLARTCRAELHLVTVIPQYSSLMGGFRDSARTLPATTTRMLELACQEAEQHLAQLTAQLRASDIPAAHHVLRGDPAATIAKAAELASIDLILLASHGKTGMDAFWAGSVAHGVCSRSHCPLLLVPISRNHGT